MRNLKKFLALALAMVMAFSLMVTANAAHAGTQYGDEGDITPAFSEAVEVLTGMGVFQGDSGSFRPASNITRAEVAAIIYRLATGDTGTDKMDLYTTRHPFTDVRSDAWYAGYVGYLYNAKIIKGTTATTFNPAGSVTGYEVLAMILRAVGYDKNNEFTGATWTVEVASTATNLGILRDIDSTHYGDTLHLASRRDVVASMLFRTAAYVPMVQYTLAFGYQNTGMTGGVTGSTLNPTLGWKYFGLTDDTGIVVGNQETGEGSTRMSFSNMPYGDDIYSYNTAMYDPATKTYADYNAATYDPDTMTIANQIATFNVRTGLDLFGHKVKVWFDGRGSYQSTANVQNNNNLTTYAHFDKATKVSAVKGWYGTKAAPTALDTTIVSAGANSVGAAANGKGFGVWGPIANSVAFGRFSGNKANTSVTAATSYDLDSVYLLISNQASGQLDVVVSMNIETAVIKGEDNVNKIKTVTVPESSNEFIDAANELVGGSGGFVLEQNQLVGNSAKTLGQKEIGVHIEGTNGNATTVFQYNPARGADYEKAWFLLKPVTETVSGRVIAYNDVTGKVTLDNGTVLEQSVLYDTVVANTIPQTNSYSNATYEFYLDPVGKYLGASTSSDASFIYGTYMDYSTETSSSAFKYFLTGINLNGDKVTVPVVTANGVVINATDILKTPYRAVWNQTDAVNGIGAGFYKGWAFNGTNAWDNGNTWNATGMVQASTTQGSSGIFDVDSSGTGYGPTGRGKGDVVIGNVESTLGAVKVSDNYNGRELYFTENTKFILVSGYGTDSVASTVYNGISQLKGTNAWVNLAMAALAENVGLTSNTSQGSQHILAGYSIADMTYFHTSPFVYAQTGTASLQADVVILPANAMSQSGVSSLYYLGNSYYGLLNAYGAPASKYTMYQDGEVKNVWISGYANDSTVDANGNTNDAYYITNNGHDKFYNLKATGQTASDGEPIYSLADRTPVATGNQVINNTRYSASTYSTQTGSFVGAAPEMRNVANAKVVNVNATNFGPNVIWPNIDSLTTLNQAGSLYELNYGGADQLRVAAMLNPSNPLIVDVIYVCFDQTTAP